MPDAVRLDTIIIGNREVPFSQQTMKIVDSNAAVWASVRKRENKQMFDVEGLLFKLLPYVVPVLMFMMVIFLVWMLLDKFSVIQGIAESLETTARLLASSTQGSVTVQG